jgi:hypothetical protein
MVSSGGSLKYQRKVCLPFACFFVFVFNQWEFASFWFVLCSTDSWGFHLFGFVRLLYLPQQTLQQAVVPRPALPR